MGPNRTTDIVGLYIAHPFPLLLSRGPEHWPHDLSNKAQVLMQMESPNCRIALLNCKCFTFECQRLLRCWKCSNVNIVTIRFFHKFRQTKVDFVVLSSKRLGIWERSCGMRAMAKLQFQWLFATKVQL